MPDAPAEPEFVAHVYAPLGDPVAYRTLAELWRRCHDEFAMTEPIPGTGLPTGLPASVPQPGADTPLAGCQDATANFQAVVRRDHDVLNLSVAFASPRAAPPRRIRIGSAAPPGWREFDRWWHRLTADDGGALLGTVEILLGKLPGPDRSDWGEAARQAVPVHPGDATGWWEQEQRTGGGLSIWETTPGVPERRRRMVVLATPDQDVAQSAYTWSDGTASAALPPLGRYLMHAAKLRHHARVLLDGDDVSRVRTRCDEAVVRVSQDLPGSHGNGGLTALRAAEAEVIAVLSRVETMQAATGIMLRNMRSATVRPLPADAALGDWLSGQLAEDTAILRSALRAAERLRELARDHTPVPAAAPPVPAEPPTRSRARAWAQTLGRRTEYRMTFGIDAVKYSGRTEPQRVRVQQRLLDLLGVVLQDVGVSMEDTDRQDTGDGMMLVLPGTVEMHVALKRLLHGWRDRLADDNAEYQDRLRIRLAVSTGPISRTAIGFGEKTIIEVGRLLNSEPLRGAMRDRDDLDVAVLVSDRLYDDVVGQPGLAAAEFEPVDVSESSYQGKAWLWPAGPAGPRPPEQRRSPPRDRPDPTPPGGSSVVIIGDGHLFGGPITGGNHG